MAELPPLPDVWGNYAIQGIVEVLPPGAVSWWPSAPGWRYLAAALSLFLLWYGWRRLQNWIRNRYRREALRKLQRLESASQADSAFIQPLSRLLKATALQAAPRAEVASLSGEDWPVWLNVQTPGPVFNRTSCALLARGQYLSAPEADSESVARLLRETRLWIGTHRVNGDA